MKDTVATLDRQAISTLALETWVRRGFSHLSPAQLADLVRIVDVLRRTFRPERIYVFGSQARGTSSMDSDIDVLVVVRDAGQFPHHLAQEAYRVIGRHAVPLDIVFMSLTEFEWRAAVVTSLPAAVVGEGKLLYAGPTA